MIVDAARTRTRGRKVNIDDMILVSEDLLPHRLGIFLLIETLLPANAALSTLLLPLIQYLEHHTITPNVAPVLPDLLEMVEDLTLRLKVEQAVMLVSSVEELATRVEAMWIRIDADAIYQLGGKIGKQSLIGGFVATIHHGLSVLRFNEMALLYEAFCQYRRQNCLAKDTSINEQNFPRNKLLMRLDQQLELLGLGTVRNSMVPIAKRDLELIVSAQIRMLEKYGTPTPPQLRQVLDGMALAESALPHGHYLGYLEAMGECRYHEAQTRLHQYFDYMVATNSKHLYHVALICKALLHEGFHEDLLAMDTIEEAIAVAREHKDPIALTYMLLWLYHIMKNKPAVWRSQLFYNNTNEAQLLETLVAKLRQLDQVAMHSMALNFEVAQLMQTGTVRDFVQLLSVGESIALGDSPSTFFRLAEMATTVWSRLGCRALATTYCGVSGLALDYQADQVAYKLRDLLQVADIDPDRAWSGIKKLQESLSTNFPLFNQVQVRQLLLAIDIHLMRGRMVAARAIYEVLYNNRVSDVEIQRELIVMQVRLFIAEGNFGEAVVAIIKALDTADTWLCLQLNLLRCRIYHESSNHAKAVTLLLHQISIAKARGFVPLMAEAVIMLVNNLSVLGYVDDAWGVVRQVMPIVNSTAIPALRAQAHLSLARVAYVRYNAQKSKLSPVLSWLNLAIVGFKQRGDLTQLHQCYQLEREIAENYGDMALLAHAETGLQKLANRLETEHKYAFVSAL